MKKGQSQIVTAVLLMGIMVVLVASVYLWGVPLIQKQKDNVNLNNMESLMKELNDKIQTVASTGGRETIENVRIIGEMTLNNDGLNDSIMLSFDTTGKLVSTDSEIYLVGSNSTVVPISQPAGAIRIFSEQTGKKYDVEMALFYREVVSSTQSFKINLEVGGRTSIADGRHDIIISEAGTSQAPGGGHEGRDLFVTDVTVRFE